MNKIKKKLSKNNLKYIILVFIFLIGIGTFLVRESFAMVLQDCIDDGNGGTICSGDGGYIPPDPPPPPPPTITVHVYADGVANSKTVNYNQQVRITWDSLGATSCTNNFGGSATTSGQYDYTATTTQTFTVTCSTSAYSAYCSGTYINSSGVTSSCSDFTTTGTCVYNNYCHWFGGQLAQCGQVQCYVGQGCIGSPVCTPYGSSTCPSITYPAHPNCTWNP